jgi:hypothetical protein
MIGAVLTEFWFICSLVSIALNPDNSLLLRRFVAPWQFVYNRGERKATQKG